MDCNGDFSINDFIVWLEVEEREDLKKPKRRKRQIKIDREGKRERERAADRKRAAAKTSQCLNSSGDCFGRLDRSRISICAC